MSSECFIWSLFLVLYLYTFFCTFYFVLSFLFCYCKHSCWWVMPPCPSLNWKLTLIAKPYKRWGHSFLVVEISLLDGLTWLSGGHGRLWVVTMLNKLPFSLEYIVKGCMLWGGNNFEHACASISKKGESFKITRDRWIVDWALQIDVLSMNSGHVSIQEVTGQDADVQGMWVVNHNEQPWKNNGFGWLKIIGVMKGRAF